METRDESKGEPQKLNEGVDNSSLEELEIFEDDTAVKAEIDNSKSNFFFTGKR